MQVMALSKFGIRHGENASIYKTTKLEMAVYPMYGNVSLTLTKSGGSQERVDNAEPGNNRHKALQMVVPFISLV